MTSEMWITSLFEVCACECRRPLEGMRGVMFLSAQVWLELPNPRDNPSLSILESMTGGPQVGMEDSLHCRSGLWPVWAWAWRPAAVTHIPWSNADKRQRYKESQSVFFFLFTATQSKSDEIKYECNNANNINNRSAHRSKLWDQSQTLNTDFLMNHWQTSKLSVWISLIN